MVAILFLANGPKSIASVFPVVFYHISNLKSIGEVVLKISRSQVGQKDGRKDGRAAFPCPTQTSFTEDNKISKYICLLDNQNSYKCNKWMIKNIP